MQSKKDILARALKSKIGLDIETFTADEVLIVAGISKGNVDKLSDAVDSNFDSSVKEFLETFVSCR